MHSQADRAITQPGAINEKVGVITTAHLEDFQELWLQLTSGLLSTGYHKT